MTGSVIILLGIAAAITGLSWFVWRRRIQTPGAIAFLGFMLAIALWSVAYACELNVTTLALKVFWARIEYLGIATGPPAWLIFILQYTGRDRRLRPSRILGFYLIPVITILLVFTNRFHGAIWSGLSLSDPGSFQALVVSHGPWFWLHTVYSYLLVLSGSILLYLAMLRSPNIYAQQSKAILIGSMAPWIGNILYLLHVFPNPYLDLTPFAFGITALTAGWGVLRLGLLDIRPVDRDITVESMLDVLIVLDAHQRIVDLNPAAEQIFNLVASEVIGKPARLFLDFLPPLIENRLAPGEQQLEIKLLIRGAIRYYEVHPSQLFDPHGRLRGWLLLIIDISARERSERRLRVQFAASKSLAELNLLSEAARPILQAVCENMDFCTGEMWQVDEALQQLTLVDPGKSRANRRR